MFFNLVMLKWTSFAVIYNCKPIMSQYPTKYKYIWTVYSKMYKNVSYTYRCMYKFTLITALSGHVYIEIAVLKLTKVFPIVCTFRNLMLKRIVKVIIYIQEVKFFFFCLFVILFITLIRLRNKSMWRTFLLFQYWIKSN